MLAPGSFTRASVPVRAEDHFERSQIRRAKRYARGRAALGATATAAELALLAALVVRARRSGAKQAVAAGATGTASDAGATGGPGASGRLEVARGAAAGAGLALASMLVTAPAGALSHVHGRRYGLATQSWKGWFSDLVRVGAIQAAFAAAAGGAAVALMRRWPARWWAPAAGIWWSFSAALAALSPVVLDPLFNDFVALDDDALARRVLELGERAGVRLGRVLRVDASRRTSAANAYVAGLGPTKRVVLFDTLLDSCSAEEVAVVVAHELAHVRHRDVWRVLAFAALTCAPATLTVQRIAAALAPDAQGTAGALPALALAGGAAAALLSPGASLLSRAVERRADSFALELSRAAEAYISFQRRIAVRNLADLQPGRVRRALLSHPPVLERIAVAAAFATAAAPEPICDGPSGSPRPRTRAGS